jgi:UDP-N-acetylmuramate dehydrogenase
MLPQDASCAGLAGRLLSLLCFLPFSPSLLREEGFLMTFSIDATYALLSPHFPGRIRRNEPLAKHNPLGIGGPADLWISVASTQELIRLVQACAEEHVPLLIVGNSSNILFSDQGVEGIVAQVAARSYTLENLGNGQAQLVADAGVSWPHLVEELAQQGWGGLEFGVGIPGTLAGSVVCNAGAHNEEVGQRLQWLEVLDARGANIDGDETVAIPTLHRYEHDELDLSFRHSRFRVQRNPYIDQHGHFMLAERSMIEPAEIIARMAFSLEQQEPQQLAERIATYRRRRRQTEPLQRHAGPLFKDPMGGETGQLIEQAGLQGFTCGKVQLAPQNANYVMNLGGATAQDVIALITQVHAQVFERLRVGLRIDMEFQGRLEVGVMGD